MQKSTVIWALIASFKVKKRRMENFPFLCYAKAGRFRVGKRPAVLYFRPVTLRKRA